MKQKASIIKRYRFFLIVLMVSLALLLIWPDIGKSAFSITGANLLEMLTILPPVFILLGLLDVWVQRETMVKFMGKGSGIKGIVIGFILGSVAAGPLYAAFPVAIMMLKKGAKLSNIFIFIGAWSTTKIPLLTFEAANMGLSFMLLRLCCNIIGIMIMAWVLERMLSDPEKEAIYQNANDVQ